MAALLAATHATADWPPPAYVAVYDIFANGKLSSETRVTLSRAGDGWSIHSQTHGVKGLARFLGLSSQDQASGGWQDGSVKPHDFSHEAKVAVRKDAWNAKYDWTAGVVNTEHEEGASSLPVEPGTVDPASLTLEIQARLGRGLEKWQQAVVDEDEVDQHLYVTAPAAPLQTRIGCLVTIEVSRVRENSKRYTRFWAARDLHFIPVRMLHGKDGGHELDSRLRELTIDGEPVAAREDCADDS